jgi:hypothetical protein
VPLGEVSFRTADKLATVESPIMRVFPAPVAPARIHAAVQTS